MATTDALCILHLLLLCFLYLCLSQHASALRECHCTSGCDVGFRCASGCLKGWSGPTCQRRNIALNKSTEQSSTLYDCGWAKTRAQKKVCGDKTSSLAVDGVVSSMYWSGTCTHTALDRTSAWWTVDLGETHLITNLRIFFLKPQRMRGFLVWVDNIHRCYEHSQSNLPSSPVSISCDTPTRGRRVTVQLPTLAGSEYILNLCEVEIYECADGSFGPDCSTWCYCRDTSEVCDKTTGYCESGCKDGYTGTGCQETCPHGRYGSGCMETCGHCSGGDQFCHNVNGTCTHGCQEYWNGPVCKARECHCTSGCDVDLRCTSGCLQGWSGPTCQILNIALNKTTQQSSTVNDCPWATADAMRDVCGDKTSFLAVDGVVSSDYWSGTCTHTAIGQTSAWWRVDLGETHLITNLTIFFSQKHRMRGFLVWVDNRHLCYRQSQSNLPSSPVSISCDTPTRGQHVTVQLPTLTGSEYILNLCEVEIFECADGSFGPGCSSLCFCKNTSEVCDKTTGHCERGCTDGRTGSDCQGLCADGSFGPGCSSWCYCRNKSEVCDKTTGHCESGCKDGYTGMGCQQICPKGRYGPGCSSLCYCRNTSEVCDKTTGRCESGCTDGHFGPGCSSWCYCRNTSEVCDKTTGHCESGCKDGYTGTGCHEICPKGRYGSGCMETCGHCAGGHQNCYEVDGNCTRGCQDNWSGTVCKVCADGSFGPGCSSWCYCRNKSEVCDKTTGHCESGCKDGYTGMGCQQTCPKGRYGSGCMETCGHCAGGHQNCYEVDGNCTHGCQDNWSGTVCKECSDYRFGDQCDRRCRCKDTDEVCDKRTGQCHSGCEDGWTGQDCNTPCPHGHYGSGCTETCGHCAGGDQNCYKVDGNCTHGCQDNWNGTLCKECSDYRFGDQCDMECRCKETYEVCDKRTGQCHSGCEDGWTGLDCNTPCQDGTYGSNCTGRCGRCQGGQPCAKLEGECQTGCAPGFKRPFCQECEDYFYGAQCSSKCGHCRGNATCNNMSGQCPDGCEPGWQGMTCHQECDEGRYGDGCSEACGQCAGKCSPVNGSCDQEGCRDGWTRQGCDEACPNGTFGPACSHQCGQCLDGHVCHKVTGECPGSWCERGWKGIQCLTDCNGTGFYSYNCNETCGMCAEEVCDPITGECLRGCRPKYVGATCNLQEPSNLGGQAGAAVAYAFAVVVVVSIIIAMYFLRRRNQRKSNNEVAAASPDVVINPAYPGEGGVPDEGDADGIYVNVELTKVKVAELREYIAKREDKFVSEYGRVPRGLLHPHAAATTPEHRPKNRFKAMYPYDHSRVVLQKTPGDKHSDYINANYIDTYKKKKAFIATQGPMPKTVGDFWRMVWQEETNIIVMLTRLKEGIKVKCEKYWPEEKSPLKLGDLTITNEGVTERPDYCIRQITIQHKKLNERRQVMHLHYVTWPDHDVPSSPPLVRFWKVFRSMASESKAPVVVHCSAGVGRTGTFIALEALMERARREGVVDVHEFVLKMRADRVSMVQTKEQYLFLHQVVLEALYSDMTHMTPSLFDSRFCTDNLASASEEAILKKEWEKLVELKEELNASETEGALLSENSRKNRSKDILPADKCRPILSLPVAESNDYINAVFVPTQTRQKGLLATQLPLPWTVVDFWRMVFDHNVQTVVSLVSEECSSQVDEALFWPKTNKVLECGPFRVEKLESNNKAIALNVLLKDSDESTKREVMLLFVSDWEEGSGTPTNTSQFLCLINDLDSRISAGNIAVMCMDGASKCGLLCAVLNIIQRLKQDQEIDVYLAVRLLQTVRPSFMTSFAQYQFCYRMIKEYQKTVNTVYENFRG